MWLKDINRMRLGRYIRVQNQKLRWLLLVLLSAQGQISLGQVEMSSYKNSIPGFYCPSHYSPDSVGLLFSEEGQVSGILNGIQYDGRWTVSEGEQPHIQVVTVSMNQNENFNPGWELYFATGLNAKEVDQIQHEIRYIAEESGKSSQQIGQSYLPVLDLEKRKLSGHDHYGRLQHPENIQGILLDQDGFMLIKRVERFQHPKDANGEWSSLAHGNRVEIVTLESEGRCMIEFQMDAHLMGELVLAEKRGNTLRIQDETHHLSIYFDSTYEGMGFRSRRYYRMWPASIYSFVALPTNQDPVFDYYYSKLLENK